MLLKQEVSEGLVCWNLHKTLVEPLCATFLNKNLPLLVLEDNNKIVPVSVHDTQKIPGS